MKNILYYLKNSDKKELAKAYFHKFLVKGIYNSMYYDKERRNMTLDEYYKKSINSIISYINRLCKLKPVELSEDEQLVFIRHEAVDDYDLAFKYDINVYRLKDVFSNKKHIEGYSYTFNHQDEIISYYIADTYYNKNHITDILIDILYEASFVGYENDHDKRADKIIKNIDKTYKELNTNKKEYCHSWSETRMLLFGKTKKQIREEDKYEKRKAQNKVKLMEIKYTKAYNKYYYASLMFQLNEIRNNHLLLEDEI